MYRSKETDEIPAGVADQAYWMQLHAFQFCNLCFCYIPSVWIVLRVFPQLWAYLRPAARGSDLLVLQVMLVGAFVALFVGLAYLASMLAAVGNVPVVRLTMPTLRMPAARQILLGLYSDRRWLYQSRGFKSLPWWLSLWSGMGSNPRLIGICRALTGATIRVVYGEE